MMYPIIHFMFLQHKQYDLSSSTDRIHSFQIKGASTVVGIYINTMKTTFYLSFDVKQAYFKLNSQQREAVPIHSWLLPCSHTPLKTPLFLYSPDFTPVPILPWLLPCSYTLLTTPLFLYSLTTPLFLHSSDYTHIPIILWLRLWSIVPIANFHPISLLPWLHSCSFTPLFLYSPISIIPWLHPPVPILPWLHTPVPILPYFYNSLTTPSITLTPYFYNSLTTPLFL